MLASVIWNAEECTTAGNAYLPIFDRCSALKTVIFGENVKTIPSYAFYNCKFLINITLPDSVTGIGYNAFSKCTSLEKVVWNAEECTTVGNASYPIFNGCTALKTVSFGENVKIIPSYTFYSCSSLTSIIVPDSVTSIGESAFYGCSSLTSIVIPAGITSIEESMFYNCNSLSNITLPNTIINIGSNAFFNCSALTSIIIPDSVASIGDRAFYNCTKLQTINYTGGSDEWYSISKGEYYWTNTGNYTINFYYSN